MSDYTQSTFFTPKDSLTPGDPLKVIKGADFDPEFAAISTAIASKVDDTGEVATFAALTDPGADRLLFWDDSATAYAYMTVGTGLAIEGGGTTIAVDLQGFEDLGTAPADRIVFWDLTTSNFGYLDTGANLVISGTTISAPTATIEANVNHDNLTGFVANEHIDHTAVTIASGTGLTGGGDISASRTLNIAIDTIATFADTIDSVNDTLVMYDSSTGTHFQVPVGDVTSAASGFVPTSRTLTAGNGLSGGGDLSANRTFDLDLSELGLETSIAASDHVIMVDVTDNGSQKITLANFATSIEGSINHDNTAGFVSNEHINHSTVSITAGTGLSGGGNIAASRTIDLDQATTSALGGVELATQAEVDAGTDAQRAVTPSTLANTSLVLGSADTKVKDTSTSRASTTTLADDPDLSGWALTAGKRYLLRIIFDVSESGTGDWKTFVQFSSTPQYCTAVSIYGGRDSIGTAEYSSELTANTTSMEIDHADGGAQGYIDYIFQANASTGGTLDFQWAQQISNATPTVLSEGTCGLLFELD